MQILYFFVCFFGVFRPTREFLHSYGDVTITGERLQMLTYARHLWTLSSDDSLVCQTFCGTGRPFIMVISEDPWHSHLLTSALTTCFYDVSVAAGNQTPNLPLAGRTLLPTAPPLRQFCICHTVNFVCTPTQ